MVPQQSLTRSRVVSQLKRIPKYSSCLDWTQSRCTILDPVGDHLLGRQHHFTTSITFSSVTNIYKHSPDHKCTHEQVSGLQSRRLAGKVHYFQSLTLS